MLEELDGEEILPKHVGRRAVKPMSSIRLEADMTNELE
jgi:hypothetical protein